MNLEKTPILYNKVVTWQFQQKTKSEVTVKMLAVNADNPTIGCSAIKNETLLMRKTGFAEYGFPFHTLRHTYPSMLFESGENPKVIQQLPGHRDVTTTIRTYNTALSGCYFKDDISRCPKHPRHTNCDCKKINMGAPRAVAYCDINKFKGYIFSDQYASNRKRDLFEQLGFTDQDSEFLKSEYERQAREKYISGNYRLGNQTVTDQE